MKYDFTTILDRKGHDSLAVDQGAHWCGNPFSKILPKCCKNQAFTGCPHQRKSKISRKTRAKEHLHEIRFYHHFRPERP